MHDLQNAGAATPTTCGQGLAAHAPLVAKVGDFVAALAENLEAHLTTLDLSDQNARAEYEAYVSLSHAHRDIAHRLAMTGAQMAEQRDLPMAKHNPAALRAPSVVDAFKQYIECEEALIALLQSDSEANRRLMAKNDPK